MQRGRRRGGSRRTLLLLLLLTAAWALAAGPAPAGAAAGAPAAANVHTVFLTDCTPYSDWQTAVMVFGWRESGQPGALTRVMCCTPEEEAAYRELRGALLRIVDTHIAPSFARNPRTGDAYPPYNKPGGVAHWLNTTPPPEDWILVLDSDMILRRPFDPDDYMHLSRGWATGARYDYLIGVDNELAERHIPGAPRRNDSLAGPPGRRADRIGGFYFIHREDLARVAPLWLKYAEDVRDDPEVGRAGGGGSWWCGRARSAGTQRIGWAQGAVLERGGWIVQAPAAWWKAAGACAVEGTPIPTCNAQGAGIPSLARHPLPLACQAWHLSGDFYSKTPGERPWISEMYGYVFGAATVNISHKWDEISMIYPGYMPQGGWPGCSCGPCLVAVPRPGCHAERRSAQAITSTNCHALLACIECNPCCANANMLEAWPPLLAFPSGVPRILHYGLLWNVEHEGGEWSFDKHW